MIALLWVDHRCAPHNQPMWKTEEPAACAENWMQTQMLQALEEDEVSPRESLVL